MIEAKFEGLDLIESDIDRRLAAIVAGADKLVAAVARDGAERIRTAMLAQRSPSPAGSEPAVVTGNLIRSIRNAHMAGTLSASIMAGTSGRSKAPHWFLLEFGTRRMAARPFIRPNGRAAAENGKAAMVEMLRRI